MARRRDYYTCQCGKRGYPERKTAAAVRRGHPGRRHLGLYRCPQSQWWHLGHRPEALTRGDITRHELEDQ